MELLSVHLLSALEEIPEEVEIKVVDYDTDEVASKRKVKVSLLM